MQVFTEAEVRASLVFHLSNLVTLLLAGARQAAQGTAWDPMVAGEASSAHLYLHVKIDCKSDLCIPPMALPGTPWLQVKLPLLGS